MIFDAPANVSRIVGRINPEKRRWDGARRLSVEGWGGTRFDPFSPLVMRCLNACLHLTALPSEPQPSESAGRK